MFILTEFAKLINLVDVAKEYENAHAHDVFIIFIVKNPYVAGISIGSHRLTLETVL